MAVELGRITVNNTDIIELDSNPSLGSGFNTNVDVGDQAIDTATGKQYAKTGSGATDWSPMSLIQFETRAISASGTLTLTANSPRIQDLSGAAAGYSVVLPDATTMIKGDGFHIHNRSSSVITVKKSDGSTLFNVGQTTIAYITLVGNSSAAGDWNGWQTFVTGTASGILNYTSVASSAFNTTGPVTDQNITSFTVTPVAGKYVVLLSLDATIGTNNIVAETAVKVGSTVDSTTRRVIQGVGSNFRAQSACIGVVDADGSQAIQVVCSIPTGSLSIGNRTLALIRLGAS